jgi:integrase
MSILSGRGSCLKTTLEVLFAELATFRQARMASTTDKDYAFDWKTFRAWCDRMRLEALPASPETLALFIADFLQRGRKVSTVTRYAQGVAYFHRHLGFPSPLDQYVKDILWGARRLRCEQLHQMRPLTVGQLRQISVALMRDGTRVAVRDRALLVVGLSSAMRRSNICALRLEDVQISEQGLTIRLRKEKQDRQGKGRRLAVPRGEDEATCPVRSLEAWLQLRGSQPGPLFTRCDSVCKKKTEILTGNAVLTLVKKAVARIGLDPSQFGAHSLRAGLVTEAGLAGVSALIIGNHTGQSVSTVQRYFRPGELFENNAAGKIGL